MRVSHWPSNAIWRNLELDSGTHEQTGRRLVQNPRQEKLAGLCKGLERGAGKTGPNGENV